MAYSKRKWKKRSIERIGKIYRTAIANDIQMTHVYEILSASKSVDDYFKKASKSKVINGWCDKRASFMGTFMFVPTYPENNPESVMFSMYNRPNLLSLMTMQEFLRMRTYWLANSHKADGDPYEFFDIER